MDKKGQGLSLNVIIIAALALIVLVVLIMVFTGRIGVFDRGVGQESQAELIKMRISYGKCAPSSSAESSFISQFNAADSPEAEDTAKSGFRENELNRCKAFETRDECEGQNCKWD